MVLKYFQPLANLGNALSEPGRDLTYIEIKFWTIYAAFLLIYFVSYVIVIAIIAEKPGSIRMRLILLVVSAYFLVACGGTSDGSTAKPATVGISTPSNVSAVPSQ